MASTAEGARQDGLRVSRAQSVAPHVPCDSERGVTLNGVLDLARELEGRGSGKSQGNQRHELRMP